MTEALAHYEITSRLGAGGMGEVYRAHDTKLGRDVAIKVLPDLFARDPDRLARFEREARLLASLSHPNVAAIHGLEESEGRRFLVLELVPGETLAERIARGSIPTDEAIEIAIQIAEALEAAHEKGIVHRDLKPSNVKLSPDGRVKVLDFGLAKALSGADDSGDRDVSSLATMTRDATQAGVILGTPAYMSPEQARGKPVDRRADLWAFGVVLFEMLTGRTLFRGETLTDTVAEVLKTEFDWDALPAHSPRALRRLLRRCLERDPRRRLRDAGDARLELEEARSGEPEAGAPPPAAAVPIRRIHWRGLILQAALMGAFIAVSSQVIPEWARRGAAVGPPLRRFAIPVERARGFAPAISPDGARVAYASDGQLYVRDLDRLEPRPIEGADEVQIAFWSPDGSQLAFGAGSRLYKVPANGSDPPVAIADLSGSGFSDVGGGAWLADDTLLFSTGGGGLYRVAAQGGDPAPALEPDDDGEIDFHAVRALPGGSGALFVVHRTDGTGTIAAWQEGRRRNLLQLPGESLVEAAYSPTGHLVYDRQQGTEMAIWAVRVSLDGGDLGEPFLVRREAGRPDVAADGTLVYLTQTQRPQRELLWVTRDGDAGDPLLPPQSRLDDPALSPDGSQLAYSAEVNNSQDVWVADLGRGSRRRITFGNGRYEAPAWFPDGERLAFECGARICVGPVDGSSEPESLIEGFQPSVAGDGTLYYAAWGKGTRSDVWAVDPTDPQNPTPVVQTPAREQQPRVSPDGHYLAYVSDETGRFEVFLRRIGAEDGRWQVSQDGGATPRWRSDGAELFFATPRELWAVAVSTAPVLELGPPESLFSWRGGRGWYDVASDGERFAALRWTEDERPSSGLVVVQSWYSEFER